MKPTVWRVSTGSEASTKALIAQRVAPLFAGTKSKTLLHYNFTKSKLFYLSYRNSETLSNLFMQFDRLRLFFAHTNIQHFHCN